MALTVLVTEDDLAALAELSRGLRDAGHQVITARDGLAALEQVLTAPPDVVLADVALPRMNGFQLCRRLRDGGATARVPVVLMSDSVTAADHYWATQVGARALLAKPVASDAAVAAVMAAAAPGEVAP